MNKDKNAFTLAEVLITLGIIGIVSALTLPTLMSNCRKYVIETQLKEFYSIMNQALKRAEYDYDDMDGWTWPHQTKVDITNGNKIVEANNSDYEWFQKYLQPYKQVLLKSLSTYTVFGMTVLLLSSSMVRECHAEQMKEAGM